MTREDAVRQLLLTQFDYLPVIGRTEFASAPGAAPTKRRCTECGGMGKILVVLRESRKKGWRLCLVCNGTGWKKATRAEVSAGEADDPYTFQAGAPPIAEGERVMSLHEIDRTLERVEAAWFGAEPHYRDPRDAQDRLGSYKELRYALELLSQAEPLLSEALRAFLSASEGRVKVSAWVQSLEREAVSWLVVHMPDPIRVPVQEAENEQRKTIRELLDMGWKKKRIARELHVDLRTVKRAVAAV